MVAAFLCAQCSDCDSSEKRPVIPEHADFDKAGSAWFKHQSAALSYATGERCKFTIFDIAAEDLLALQKESVRELLAAPIATPDAAKRVQGWINEQNAAAKVMGLSVEIRSAELPELLKAVDAQAKLIRQIKQ